MADSSPFSNIPVEVTISVGRARPRISELLSLGENAVLPLDRKIDDPVELYVGDRLIARGELQELDGENAGQLAVRLTDVADLDGPLT
ncbi:FliM/FliN family flagellar motor switch protein [Aestuariibius sp. 2305UL40-4]|uniref:FliM/FliN family flagellar motor switch protein n=1 Tax=Aestuariibius violaceus TaxID=3234132 RepID=UPI00345E5A35